MSIDFEAARTRMVDNQLRTTDVTSYGVIDAFLTVPREEFVPARFKPLAYIDTDIEIAPMEAGRRARYLMEPSPLAKLVQLAQVGPEDVVLEIGCGTGYASAILSLLAGSVVALELDEKLAAAATDTLARLGYDNVAVVSGPLTEGCQAEAPYDVIFIGGAVEQVPEALFQQLRDGGRLVVVEGLGNASRAKMYLKEDGVVAQRASFNTSVKPLPGFEKTGSFRLLMTPAKRFLPLERLTCCCVSATFAGIVGGFGKRSGAGACFVRHICAMNCGRWAPRKRWFLLSGVDSCLYQVKHWRLCSWLR